jgi:hypothetical protein
MVTAPCWQFLLTEELLSCNSLSFYVWNHNSVLHSSSQTKTIIVPTKKSDLPDWRSNVIYNAWRFQHIQLQFYLLKNFGIPGWGNNTDHDIRKSCPVRGVFKSWEKKHTSLTTDTRPLIQHTRQNAMCIWNSNAKPYGKRHFESFHIVLLQNYSLNV